MTCTPSAFLPRPNLPISWAGSGGGGDNCTHTAGGCGMFGGVLVLKNQNKCKSDLLFLGYSRECTLLYWCACYYSCFCYLFSPIESSALRVLFSLWSSLWAKLAGSGGRQKLCFRKYAKVMCKTDIHLTMYRYLAIIIQVHSWNFPKKICARKSAVWGA